METVDERALGALAGRIYGYRLLHILFGSHPTAESLALLGSATTAEASGALAAAGYAEDALPTAVVAAFGDRLEESAFSEALQGQYTRLFMVPGDGYVKPWESVYTSPAGTLFAASTLDVRRRYEALGFAAREKGHFPEDHLSMMLDFMAAVAERAYEAVVAGDDGRGGRRGGAPAGFAPPPVMPWLDDLAAALEEQDATGFYAVCARTTERFVAEDERMVGSLVALLAPEAGGCQCGCTCG